MLDVLNPSETAGLATWRWTVPRTDAWGDRAHLCRDLASQKPGNFCLASVCCFTFTARIISDHIIWISSGYHLDTFLVDIYRDFPTWEQLAFWVGLNWSAGREAAQMRNRRCLAGDELYLHTISCEGIKQADSIP